MQEKRRNKRLPIQLNLEVSEVFKQDSEVIPNLDATINVFNISKDGIGFTTSAVIPIGYYFNATITLGDSSQKLYTVVKVLYSEAIENNMYHYGCEFVGLANIFDYLFKDYEKELEQ